MTLTRMNLALAVFNVLLSIGLCVTAAQNYRNARVNLQNANRNLALAQAIHAPCDSGSRAKH